MKNKKGLLVITLASITLMSFTQIYFKMVEQVPIEITVQKVKLPKILIEVAPLEINQQEMFLTAIGHRESSNRYDVVNKWGYMGKYQFGSSTLKTLKIKVSRSEFLRDTLLQEEAMLKLLLHNKKRLQKYIDRYEGQVINGILVTESGLLAAAHLGGQGSVRKWFRNGKVRKDGNGIKITTYMKRFSGYDLYL